jgi:autophagy-related protein 18
MEDLQHVSFNQDSTLLTTGSASGFSVFKIEPFELLNQDERAGFRIVEIYEMTQLLLLVGSGEHPAFSPKRLTIWNISERAPICETSFPETILAVRMNRLRIVVAIIDAIYVYNTTTMKTQHVFRTVENLNKVLDLSPSSENCFLVFPASLEKGSVQVCDCFSMEMRGVIEAHSTSLAVVGVSYSGNLLATSSTKGTIIRVFSLPEGEKLFTFKRGLYPAQTYSLRFSFDSNYLVCTSSSGSLHIFSLQHSSSPSTWSVSKTLSSAATYFFSDSLKDRFEASRSIFSFKTGFSSRFLATLSSKNDSILAVSHSSDFLILSFETFESRVIQAGKLTSFCNIKK